MDIEFVRSRVSRTELDRLLALTSEDEELDFKSTFDSGEGWPDLLKDIMAFANSAGGHIVFGVSEDKETKTFRACGLPPGVVVDDIRLHQEAEKYLTKVPLFHVAHHPLDDGRRFALLYVAPSPLPICAVRDGYRPSENGRQGTKVFTTRDVYHRTGTQSEPVKDIGTFLSHYLTARHVPPVGRSLSGVAAQSRPGGEPISMVDVLVKAYGQLEWTYAARKVSGIETGFRELDNAVLGLHPGDLVLIVARPSVGKTLLALSLARNIALLTHTPVVMFSLQWPVQELGLRFLATEAAVDLNRLRRGLLQDQDWSRLGVGLTTLAEGPIAVIADAEINCDSLSRVAEQAFARMGPGVVIIDTIHGVTLSAGNSPESGEAPVMEVFAQLKRMARRLNVPVVVTANCSRTVDIRPDRHPQLKDLQGLEDLADVVLGLARDPYQDQAWEDGRRQEEEKRWLEVKVLKNPYGPLSAFDLEFTNYRLMGIDYLQATRATPTEG